MIGSTKEETPLGAKNSNRTNVLAKLSDAIIDNECNFGSMNTSTNSGTTDTDAQQLFASKSNVASVFDTLNADSQYASSIATSNGASSGGPQLGTSAIISSMPNQLKANFVAHFNPAAVRNEPTNDWIYTAEFNINNQFLAMVERFDGFDMNWANPSAWANTGNQKMDRTFSTGEVGQLSVRRPRWRTLTEEFYRNSRGKEILCRLCPYTCVELGIKRKPGTSAPIFDSYFIIVPPMNDTVTKVIPRQEDVHKQRLEMRWQRTERFANQFSTTNLIT